MTKNSKAVLIAAERGYSVDSNGSAFKPNGDPQPLYLPPCPRHKYFAFAISTEFGRSQVRVHRLVAFQNFGIAALLPGVHTRHLNGDSLDNRAENIAIGSRSDNMMDRSPESRRLHAQLAGRSNSLPESTWEEVINDRDSGMTYKQITEKYGISKSTLSFRLSKTGKKQVMR